MQRGGGSAGRGGAARIRDAVQAVPGVRRPLACPRGCCSCAGGARAHAWCSARVVCCQTQMDCGDEAGVHRTLYDCVACQSRVHAAVMPPGSAGQVAGERQGSGRAHLQVEELCVGLCGHAELHRHVVLVALLLLLHSTCCLVDAMRPSRLTLALCGVGMSTSRYATFQIRTSLAHM